MKKYIIDTDIGDDIDDAFALHLAMHSNLNLVAVTTVYRNAFDRARLAKRLIALYGKDIPVYFGYGIDWEYFDTTGQVRVSTDIGSLYPKYGELVRTAVGYTQYLQTPKLLNVTAFPSISKHKAPK